MANATLFVNQSTPFTTPVISPVSATTGSTYQFNLRD
jgi:hypothetical protein